ncbi:MAG TPA: CotH kinase family protein [Ruminiclostridium sp.]|nr:CotH kinase family protein [Ruminiclostridium sp.]
MKKFLSAAALSLIVTVLTTCVLGCCTAFAAEAGNAKLTSSEIEKKQLEMPIITVNTVSESKIDTKEKYTDAQISIINDDGKYDVTNMATSIKLRGNSSLNADKKSYKMKFEEKQNLLNVGEGKAKTWTLIANYYDGSLLRNLTAYHFADLLTGISYSPNCRSVELYINGEYQGVYLLCEEVSVSKNRVAIEEKPDEVEKDGYLVEMSRYTAEDMFAVDTATYEIKSDLSATESIKKRQIDYISNYIKKSYDSLVSGNKKDVEKYIDINSLVDIYIGNEIVKNVDAGWGSFYMYKDVKGKLCFGPMWDFDLAMGNANCTKGCDSWQGFNPYHVLNYNANSNPWFCHALTNKWFRDLVKKRWNELKSKINELPKTVIKEAESNFKSYSRNFEKWDVLGKQVYIEPAQITALKTFKDHYNYLSDWLANRVNWLSKYYNSKDFSNGIFVNESGKVYTADYNLLEISPILALENASGVDMSYKLSPKIGTTISIRDGGKETWNTQIDASGFMLEKGAEYVLSFDYQCSKELPLTFNIQQNYGTYTSYYNDKVNVNSKVQHYEATLKAPATDSNCALVFDLGGGAFNGSIITVDNMSLVKKSAPTVGGK